MTIALMYRHMGGTARLGTKKKTFITENIQVVVKKLSGRKEWKVIEFENGKMVDSDIVSEDFAKILVGEILMTS